MFAGNWFKKNSRHNIHRPLKKGLRRKEAQRGRSLRVEALEDRRMLATFIVQNTLDVDNDGNTEVGSLRQAIELSNATPNETDTIVFAEFLTSGGQQANILLNGGQLPTITDEVAILGPGAAALTITNTQGNNRIFDLNIPGEDFNPVTIGGLTLTGGNLGGGDNSDDNRGGAIRSADDLTLIETEILGNSASQGGGAIFAPSGSLSVQRSLLEGNSSGGGGGAIFVGTPGGDIDDVFVTVVDSTISGNSTTGAGNGDDFRPGYGGGIFTRSGSATISSSTIADNTASALGGGVASFGNPRPDELEDPIPLSVTDNDFEEFTPLPDPNDPMVTGFIPSANPGFNVWFGDQARIVPATEEVVPNRGLGQLQFLATTVTGPVSSGDNTSDVWQLIDFSAYQAILTPDATPDDTMEAEPPDIPTVDIDFQALFNRIAGDENTDTDFVVTIQLHGGTPDTFDPNGSVLQAGAALDAAGPDPEGDNSGVLASDADPTTQQLLNTKLTLSNAIFEGNDGTVPNNFNFGESFLAVRVGVRENITDDGPPPAPGPGLPPIDPLDPVEFGGHFVDTANIAVRVVTPPDTDFPDPLVSTNVNNTIIFNNGSDIDNVGTTGGDDPLNLLLSINSSGSNLVGSGNVAIGPQGDGAQGPGIAAINQRSPLTQPITVFNQAGDLLDTNPLLSPLLDFGGSTRAYHPLAGSPIIDASQTPSSSGFFGQRGRHFTRVFGGAQDIGALEAQFGTFVVDTLEDESDNQFSPIFTELDFLGPTLTPFAATYSGTGGAIFNGATGTFEYFSGDFSLREALEFSELNPLPDTILFEPLGVPDLLLELDDPTPSNAPTILTSLTQAPVFNGAAFVTPFDEDSAFRITQPVSIIGPANFELEIDTSATDATPGIKDNQGTRLFNIDDGFGDFNTDVSISNLTLIGGDVGGDGGSILNSENLTITNSRITDNASSSEGGAIFTATGELFVEDTAIFENATSSRGGAIFAGEAFPGNADPTRVTLRNSTISGNSSDFQAAGLFNEDAEVVIEYSTIAANDSPIGAGVVSAPGSFDTVTLVRSSIIAGNIGGDDIQALAGANNFLSGNFNLIGQGNFLPGGGNATDFFSLPSDIVDVDNPGLAPLANIGGLTFVHSLLPGSPAIDAGNPFAAAGIGNVPEFDQRGGGAFQRVFDGLQNSQAVIDIGAFELQSVTLTVDSLTDENDGFTGPGGLSLREAIEIANVNPLPDTINFEPGLFTSGSQTISQNSANSPFLQPETPTDIRITDSVEIVGPGTALLSLDGTAAAIDFFGLIPGSTRFFTIDDEDENNTIDVEISGLTFTNSISTADDGGAILSRENLVLRDVQLEDNSTFDLDLPNTEFSLQGGAISQQGAQLTLDGVEITGNFTDAVGGRGGAVHVLDAELLVLNQSILSGNSTLRADSGGAAVFAENSTVRVEQSYLTGNITEAGDSRGAALYALNSDLDITDFSFVGGNSTRGAQSRGAGVYSLNSDVDITNATIVNNSTLGTFANGAGISSVGGNLNVSNSIVSNNSTFGLGSDGGGIAGNGATIVLEEVTLAGNSTAGENASGGGISNLNGDVTILSSVVTGNSADDPDGLGGGVANDTNLGSAAQSTRIINSTISGNSAGGQGGGLFNARGLTQILNSTVTNNDLTGAVPVNFGSGVASFGNPVITRTEVGSSIIAGNASTDVDSPGGVFGNSFVSLGFNLVGNGSSIAAFSPATQDIVGVDPLLGPLTSNGGATQTHALLENSPAINAGSPIASPLPSEDQRGFLRIQDTQIDIGAFESIAPTDFTGDGFVDGADFLAFQRGFGTPNANQADGDANGDDVVDGTDLELFRQDYGNLPIGGFSALAASSAPGEPLLTTTVLAVSPAEAEEPASISASFLAGFDADVASETLAPVVEEDLAEAESEGAAVRDELFAGYSTLDEDAEDLASGSDEVGFEPTAEDQVFELLGAF